MSNVDQAAWCEGWRKSPWWLRVLGGRPNYYADQSGTYRMSWGELTLRPSGLALAVGAYSSAHLHVGFGFGQAFIRLPFLDRALARGFGESPRYGFSCDRTTAHLSWGRATKIVWWPWTREPLSRHWLAADGTWVAGHLPHGTVPGAVRPWAVALPYHYMLDNGEVQSVTATVRRERAVYGWRWLGPKPLRLLLRKIGPKRSFEGIAVEFSDEVGASRGSWKGGCVACGYDMRPGETPEQTLRRMQRERRFR